MIAPSALADRATSSVEPTAISTGTSMRRASSLVMRSRVPRRQAASARRSELV
jgi:hypothetical protein